jgi:hypothetical protein
MQFQSHETTMLSYTNMGHTSGAMQRVDLEWCQVAVSHDLLHDLLQRTQQPM